MIGKDVELKAVLSNTYHKFLLTTVFSNPSTRDRCRVPVRTVRGAPCGSCLRRCGQCHCSSAGAAGASEGSPCPWMTRGFWVLFTSGFTQSRGPLERHPYFNAGQMVVWLASGFQALEHMQYNKPRVAFGDLSSRVLLSNTQEPGPSCLGVRSRRVEASPAR